MDWLWRMGDAVQGDAFIVWPGWTAVPSLAGGEGRSPMLCVEKPAAGEVVELRVALFPFISLFLFSPTCALTPQSCRGRSCGL